MEFTGKVAGITMDFMSGKYNISFQADSADAVTSQFDGIKDAEKLTITAVKFRQKRSLDANAYYWQLITKLAEAMHISKGRMHNMILRKYGQREYIEGKLVTLTLPDTDKAENTALEAETYHIGPTSQVREGKDGTMYRTYVMYRGSHDYDTREMSELINGLISECKEVGIETLTPAELAEMMKAWKP